MACAFLFESARPRSTNRTSSRFLPSFAFMAGKYSRSANYQIFRNLAQASGFPLVRQEFRNRFAGEFIGDFVRARESMNRGVGGLLLRHVLSRGFAKRRGRFLDVQNVVGDLKGPADGF